MKSSLLPLLFLGLMLPSSAHAADEVIIETLPKPRIVVAPEARPVYFYPRVSRYEVWQNYGVTRSGKWRPLVISGPYGAYYRYNGEPFPWTVTHSQSVTPFIVD